VSEAQTPVAKAKPLLGGWRWSLAPLVAANLLPLAGVMLWGWDVFLLIYLFWLENLVIGAFNVLRMVTVTTAMGAPLPARLVLPGFFVIHYGGFCLGHGFFVLAIFGREVTAGGFGPLAVFHVLGNLPTADRQTVQIALLALAVSHGFSFAWNFLRRGEYRRTSLAAAMLTPYGRIVVLHVTLIIGGALVMATGGHAAALALLAVLKIGMDACAHLWEHGRLGRLEAAMEEQAPPTNM
jgi:hypothetical protein